MQSTRHRFGTVSTNSICSTVTAIALTNVSINTCVHFLQSCYIIIVYTIFSTSANCDLVLSRVAVSIYFTVVLLTTFGITALTYSITQSKMNAQVIVVLQALFNQVIMLIAALLVIGVHFRYQHNYPLQRDSRATDIPCIMHSVISVVITFVPSESLIIMTLIHYRIIFWARYTQIPIKVGLLVAIVTWVIIISIASAWTSLQGRYIGWYCLPYLAVGSARWFSLGIRCIITLTSLLSMSVCIRCYVKMILYLRKEDAAVKTLVTRKISNSRNMIFRFSITLMLYFAQSLVMNVLIWIPTYGETREAAEPFMFICYVFCVVICDLYLYVYVILKRTLCF